MLRWRRALAAALLGLAVIGAVAWGLRPGRQGLPEAGPSVLLITVDTLRADALGAYGNPRARTPWMDRLAALGARYDDAHAHNVVTLPSHANILSGRYPQDHGVRDNSGFRFPAGLETLATLLKGRGYRTAAFVSAFPLDSRFGLARGFDVYDDHFVDAEARPAFLEQERAANDTVILARRWLEAQGDAPTFCWVHVYEPHFPYAPAEPFAARFRGSAYDGEVAATDAALGPLLERVLGAGRSGQTLVVLTSDHGESLGEHGEATHGIFAYEATLRVPLILYQPRLFEPRAAREPARHVDLLPTILDALSLPVPEGLPGRSLLGAAAAASTEPTTSYFEALSGQLNRGWAPLYGVIRQRTKYIELPLPEVYDLGSDAAEARNLAAREPARLEELRSLLAPLLRRASDKRPETAETRERLKSLGYLAARATPTARSYAAEDDPKRLIELDSVLQEVIGHYLAGELPTALARCRELVRRRPGMAMSLLTLAQLERESGNPAAAVEALRKAVSMNPADTSAVSLLGATLTQLERAREAVELLEPYVRSEQPDVDLLLVRGLALAKLARFDEAHAQIAKAGRVDPSNARVLVSQGTVHLMGDDRGRARASFEAALALNPDVARAHSSLGLIAAEEGRVQDAIAHWKRAVSDDPREWEQLLTLGTLLWRRGQAAEARHYLEFFVASAPSSLYTRDIERVRAWLAAAPPAPSSRPSD